MIDPNVSLAFSVYSGKGVYALLLGSGISRPSGIPTGWEVTLDLVRKVAKLEGDDCEADPAAWFARKHGTEPDYSQLLDAIAKTPAERQQLLRSYFEPSEDERTQGLKTPSAAHKAIGRLVADGYLRVIVTTNFDRLLEKALEDAGVAPSVVSTPDQIAGMLPLTHSGATVIKVNGDYLDTRIKNTESELAGYDTQLNKLLDRVFEEYGIIVCGWSADWDSALRASIERCSSRRHTTFWATHSAFSEHAKRLVEHRRAEVIQIRDANQFFEGLHEKVLALGDMNAPHPLSTKMAVATVKRYLTDPNSRIRLRDLVHDETEKLYGELNGEAFTLQPASDDATKIIIDRLSKYEVLSEALLAIIVAGSYWGSESHLKLWTDCLQRIANPSGSCAGLVYLSDLRLYPALLLLYGAGLAAVASGNYKTLAAILTQPNVVKNNDGIEKPLCSLVYPIGVLSPQVHHYLSPAQRRYTPLNDRLYEKLRAPLREYLPRDNDYTSTFDRFEYLYGLVHADLNRVCFQVGWWGPVGQFKWRRVYPSESHIMHVVVKELDSEKSNWPLLKAGLFGGSVERAIESITRYNEFLDRVQWF